METNKKIHITVKNVAQINKPNQDKEVTPLTVDQEITADNGNVLGKVVVKAIPETYIEPEGELRITEQGTFDVKSYETVNVTAPFDKLFNQYMNNTLTQIREEDLEGATSLKDSAFINCSSLISVVFAENSQLKVIDISTFEDCIKLSDISEF